MNAPSIVLLVLLLFLPMSTLSEQYEEKSRTRDGTNSGLIPFYDMWKIFLNDVVQPKTIGDILEDYNIETWDDFGNEFQEHWDEWLLYILGFIICIVVGIIFMIVMPFCGCCVCCYRSCRCCCCCCRSSKQKNSSKCKKITCSALLFTMAAMMLTTTIIVFVTNDVVSNEMSATGITNDIIEACNVSVDYFDDTMDEVNDTIIEDLFNTTDDIVVLLDSIPADSLSAIEDEYGIGRMTKDLSDFAHSLGDLSFHYEEMINLTLILRDKEQALEANLTESRRDIGNLLNDTNCNEPSCDDALAELNNLTTDAKYLMNLTDVQAAKEHVDVAIALDIAGEVDKGLQAYIEIAEQVSNDTADEIEEVKKTMDDIEQEVVTGYDDLSESLDDVITSITSVYDDIYRIQEDYIDVIMPYYTGSIYILNTLFLLITFSFFLGLLLGWVCRKPGKMDGRCSLTSHQGANWLLTGVSFTFILTWLFMLITTLHFTVGGLSETMICRHLLVYDDTMVKIEEVTMASTDMNYNISFQQAMEDCEGDAALYQAGNLEQNGYNITELLDLEQYGVYDAIEELTNVTVELGTIEIITSDVNQTMLALDAALTQVNFQEFYDELEKDVTEIDLITYAEILYDVANDVQSSDPVLADNIAAEAEKLVTIHDTQVVDMESDRDQLKSATNAAFDITYSVNLSQTMFDLTDAQNRLNAEGDQLISDLIVHYGDVIIIYLEDYTKTADDAIREDIGNCRPLFDAGQTLIYGPCLYLMDPFNGLWFGYGWFIFFSIPGIIFAAVLAGIFREKMSVNAIGHFDSEIEMHDTTKPPPQTKPKSNKVAPAVPYTYGLIGNDGGKDGSW